MFPEMQEALVEMYHKLKAAEQEAHTLWEAKRSEVDAMSRKLRHARLLLCALAEVSWVYWEAEDLTEECRKVMERLIEHQHVDVV